MGQELDALNVKLQEQQKLEGSTFVSRTSVNEVRYGRRLVALRVVIGNPITEEEVIADQFRILKTWSDPQALPPTPRCQDINVRKRAVSMSDGEQEDYWRKYWERMPPAARLFFMDDMERFKSTLVAPAVGSEQYGSGGSP